MTLRERVEAVVTDGDFDFDNASDINALIAYAYYLGRHNGVRDICDKASKIFSDQRKRCDETRYHNLAMKIQGGVSYIYDEDYNDEDINSLGENETNL